MLAQGWHAPGATRRREQGAEKDQMQGGGPLFELNDGVCRRETRAE